MQNLFGLFAIQTKKTVSDLVVTNNNCGKYGAQIDELKRSHAMIFFKSILGRRDKSDWNMKYWKVLTNGIIVMSCKWFYASGRLVNTTTNLKWSPIIVDIWYIGEDTVTH